MEQTYFLIPSTSTNGSESKAVTSDLPIPKMPKESKLLKMFDTLAKFKNLGTTSVVVKSRLSVANTPKATNKKWVAKLSTLPSAFVSCDAVRFRNDHFAAITRYEDYVQGNLTICHVYYVEDLEHNFFLVGQFCDGDLEVAFCSNTCYVWNLEGDKLLTSSRDSNLYTISISEMVPSSPVCLMSRATSTKSWLWHRKLYYLNFGTINQVTSKDLVDGFLKFKYNKDHLCSACEQGKIKKASLPPKLIPSPESKLKLLHIDLYGPMRVASINGKKYILVIVDDYSQYTRVYFLRTKDEALDMIIDFVNQVQRNLKAQIITIRTDNGTEFKNEKLQSVRLVELCTLRTIVVLKGFSGIRSFVILIKTPDLSQRSPQNCPKCGNRLMVIIVKDMLFSERNLRKICLHIVLKMEFFKILPSHPITIPKLLMLFKSHSLAIKTPMKIPHKVLYKSTTIVVSSVPFNNQTIKELPQTLPSFDLTFYSEDRNSFTYDSTSNLVHDSPNEEEKQIEEEHAANARYWKILACYDNDEDDYTITITPNEPDNSLSMGDEHLDTILTTESDEFIKSSVENLVPIPSESEGDNECDVPACEDFTTFSNILFDADYDFYSIDLHHFNAESDLIESLLNHDSSIIPSSKIDSLFDEFAGELTLLKLIPSGINETDCDPEEETHFIKRLLYNNSSPRPPEEFVSENSDTAFEYFSPFPIPVEDSDSLMKEIDLSFTPDDLMPPSIEEDDYDSEMDILILDELLSNDSFLLL
nr:putative ribonuclease H-like domain-containing protein [Tanacetum cinerariifolium]